tara:strand:+ start:233 stop:655 length:423 start_codon:yes stop_codon:yes gene_type:complete
MDSSTLGGMEGVEIFDEWFEEQVESIIGALSLIIPVASLGQKVIFINSDPEGFAISPPMDLPRADPEKSLAHMVSTFGALGYFLIRERQQHISVIYSGLGGDYGLNCLLHGRSIVDVEDMDPDPRFLGIGGVSTKYKLVN